MTRKHLRIRAGAIAAVMALLAGTAAVSAATPPGPTPAGGTLEQRVAQRKAERAIVLGENDVKRLNTTCLAAQIKLRNLQKDDVAFLEKRTKIYASIDAKLWIAIGQLRLAGQDTFQLEKQHQAIVAKTGKFHAVAADYKQALDDAIVINCQADPQGFKALLETTRIYFEQLHAQSTDSEGYIINTIKPSLKTFVSDLQAKPASQEDQ